MKPLSLIPLILLLLGGALFVQVSRAFGGNQSRSSLQSEAVMTNADVIALTKQHIPERDIHIRISTSKQHKFDTSDEALIALKEAGVRTAVIVHMLRANGEPPERITERIRVLLAPRSIMTNADILAETKAKVPYSAIAYRIQRSRNHNFDTTDQALKALKEAGVHPHVIAAMLIANGQSLERLRPLLAPQPVHRVSEQARLASIAAQDANEAPISEQRFCAAGAGYQEAVKLSERQRPQDPNPIRASQKGPGPKPDPNTFEQQAMNALGPGMTFSNWRGLLSFQLYGNATLITFGLACTPSYAFQNRTHIFEGAPERLLGENGETIVRAGSPVYNVLTQAPTANRLRVVVSGRLYRFPETIRHQSGNSYIPPFQSALTGAVGVTMSPMPFLARFDNVTFAQ